MPSASSKLPNCLEYPERHNTCKHYRKSIRRCARRWAFGRDPTVPCDGWCQK